MRHSPRLDVMHTRKTRHETLHRLRSELAEGRVGRHQRGAAAEERAGPGLVVVEMRDGMRDDGVVGLAELRQRQRVGGRAVEDEEHLGRRRVEQRRG